MCILRELHGHQVMELLEFIPITMFHHEVCGAAAKTIPVQRKNNTVPGTKIMYPGTNKVSDTYSSILGLA